MTSNIILIGPMGAGKSTQGQLLSEKLGIPRRAMDDLRWGYYHEIGYSDETVKHLRETEGFPGVYRYWKPFEAHAVERILADNQGSVIDFGAGHSIYEDDELFARVQRVMEPYRDVVLLLPSLDLDESVRLIQMKHSADDFGFDEHCVRHHSNHDLAKFVVYTKDKTSEQTRDEIIALLGYAPMTAEE